MSGLPNKTASTCMRILQKRMVTQMKQKFYSSEKIRAQDCEYNLILGERSNGKSFDIKHLCLREAYHDKTGNSKFIYLRRWDLEINSSLVEQYFMDAQITLMTDGLSTGVSVYNKQIFLASKDTKGKIERHEHVGYARALSMEEHYTSGIYTDCVNIIFEEFISRQQYLAKEPQKLAQFVSTIARRNRMKVWLIGNTISRLCPYFMEWELRNIPRQKQGTIEVYSHKTDQQNEDGTPVIIRIAVEFAENSGNNSKMFFGNKNAKMITSGAWQTEAKPHLPDKVNSYHKMYEMVVEWQGFRFYAQFMYHLESGAALWYVEPKTTQNKPNTRLITDKVLIDPLATRGLYPLSPKESKAFSYLQRGIVFYSDNLTGGDFEVCLRQLLTV